VVLLNRVVVEVLVRADNNGPSQWGGPSAHGLSTADPAWPPNWPRARQLAKKMSKKQILIL